MTGTPLRGQEADPLEGESHVPAQLLLVTNASPSDAAGSDYTPVLDMDYRYRSQEGVAS